LRTLGRKDATRQLPSRSAAELEICAGDGIANVERMTTLTTAPLDYRRIAEALVHPLKLRIHALMTEPPAPRSVRAGAPEPGWSPSRLYVAVDAPLSNVSFHLRGLERPA
jgi:hypothetical protein